MRFLTSAVVVSCLAPWASASLIVVDAAGSPGTHLTINQAIAVAVPGDRILVMPGTYPAFHLSKGVSVLGAGSDPGAVHVARVDVHVTSPVVNYDASISNMTIGDGAPENVIALSGNEEPPGTVVVTGVRIVGGVFIGGGGDGFHLDMQNVSVDPAPGQGFLNAAVYLGGKPNFSAELVNTEINGWDAVPLSGIQAGVGLKLTGGMRARLASTTVRGGNGHGALPNGADAIAGGGPSGPVSLRMVGNVSLIGGDADIGGSGGDCVALSGNIEIGSIALSPGSGVPFGQSYNGPSVITLPLDPHLSLVGGPTGGQAPARLVSGNSFTLSHSSAGTPTAIIVSLELNLPPAGALRPLGAPMFILMTSSISGTVPAGSDYPGLYLMAQAFARPIGGSLVESNVQCLRLDLMSGPP